MPRMWSPLFPLVCATLVTLHAGAALAGGAVVVGGPWGGQGGVALAPPQDGRVTSTLKRPRRKVISRGGHYIVWSRGGSSPWSSTTPDATGSQGSVGRSKHREYSWHPPGDMVGDGGLQGYVGPQGRVRGSGGAARKRLNQSFKREIAQYAMVYGVHESAQHYEQAVGRRLRDRVVAKFVRRYQDRKKRKRRRLRRRLAQA